MFSGFSIGAMFFRRFGVGMALNFLPSRAASTDSLTKLPKNVRLLVFLIGLADHVLVIFRMLVKENLVRETKSFKIALSGQGMSQIVVITMPSIALLLQIDLRESTHGKPWTCPLVLVLYVKQETDPFLFKQNFVLATCSA